MSMDIDSPELPRPKKHKKHKDKSVENSEKKRKRKHSEILESSSPTKKHRSKRPFTPPTSQPIADELADSKDNSPFYQVTSSLYLPLAPISQRQPLQGLCAEHLSPLILTFYPPFHGVIISYANPRCTNGPHDDTSSDGRQKIYARSIDDCAAAFVWLTADFLIFKPQKDDVIEGFINLQNESSIGLVCWNYFSASIEREWLPKSWKWRAGGMGGRKSAKLKKSVTSTDEDTEAEEETQPEQMEDAEGYFQDGRGNKVEGLLRFKVRHVETSWTTDRENGFLSIRGSLLSHGEEQDLLEPETARLRGVARRGAGQDVVQETRMTGALINGYGGSMDVD